jgi:hypothetical protein
MLHDGPMQVRSGNAARTIWLHGGECKFARFGAENPATSKAKTLFESELPQIGGFAAFLWQSYRSETFPNWRGICFANGERIRTGPTDMPAGPAAKRPRRRSRFVSRYAA